MKFVDKNPDRPEALNLADLAGEDDAENYIILDSVIQLEGEITPAMANFVIKYIIQANFPLPDQPLLDKLTLLVKSPGGCLDSTMAIISAMRASAIPINTVALGTCMSGALMICLAGNERYVDKYCSIMSHTLSVGYGDASKHADLKRWLEDVEVHTHKLVELYQEHTGLSEAVIRDKLLPDNGDMYLTASKAIEYNLFDEYFTTMDQL